VTTHSVQQLVLPFLADRTLVVQRQNALISSDAGLLPIRQFDHQWRYTQRMAECLHDPRDHPEHSVDQMLRQRLYGILADYEDCNDHDDLSDDPILKLVAGRLPLDKPLASQPTLSRFENTVSIRCLYRLMDFFLDTGVQRLRHKHRRTLPPAVTLDIDPTDDPTHGQQQLALFHGYYGQYQYYPLIISEPTTQHVFAAHLRPGTVHAALGADKDLMRVVEALRKAREDVRVHVRGDSGFGVPGMYKVCEENDLTYTFGLASNARLKRYMQPQIDRAAGQYQATGLKQRTFAVFAYRANTWDRWRTVVAKVEAHGQGTNLRFVVTNRPVATLAEAETAYDDYIQRGTSEQRMDELKNGLHADRLSCHRFVANYWRLLLHAAAMNLLNAVRDDPSLPPVLRRGQPCTWRSCVIKVAATVVQTARRVVVELAGQWPNWRLYRGVCRRVLLAPSGP